jgi:hemin uptake protein HemP
MLSVERQTFAVTSEPRASVSGFSAERSKSIPTCGRIESHSLFQGARELLIAHAGEEYRLRLTRNDKLILTK